MVRVQVTILGADRARAYMRSMPERSHIALKDAAEVGVRVEKAAIENETPRASGTLAGSIQEEVSDHGLEEIEARVFSNLRYAKFVELGTHKHGRAQHMFRRGGERAAPEVKQIFSNATHRMVESF